MYIGYFRDNNDDSLYTVEIGTGSTTEITLSGTPFTTKMDNSDDIIYKPVKYTGATVEAITDDILYDIYNTDSRSVPVILKKGNQILFSGYNTPNAYDQGFEKKRELIQIECIDGLSTLKYYPYKQNDKQIRSFWYIINKLIGECKSYKYFYISNNMQLDKDTPSDITKDLYISEQNFFDEKQENQTDDDIAWKCNEVLENIMQYLGYTCISNGDSVFILDYDAIKKGINTYYKYTVDNETGELVTVDYIKRITGQDYSENGATVSLDNVYNKVRVTAELNSYDNTIPDLFDLKLKDITARNDDQQTVNNDKYRTITNPTSTYIVGDRIETTITPDSSWTGWFGNNKAYFTAQQYFKPDNEYLTTYMYKWDDDFWNRNKSLEQLNYPESFNYADSVYNNTNYYGCIMQRQQGEPIEVSIADTWLNPNLSNEEFTKLVSKDISSLNFTDNFMFLVKGGNKPVLYADNTNEDPNQAYNRYYKHLPMFTLNYPTTAPIGGDNAYIMITGSVVCSINRNKSYILNDFTFPHAKSYKSTVWEKRAYIWCQLKVGNLYWNGKNWTQVESDFKLYFLDKDKKAPEVAYKDNNIKNTVSWWYGVSETGTAIPIPENTIISGNIKFTMYTPMQQYDDAQQSSGQDDMRSFYIWLKDFQIKAVIGDPSFSDKNDTDTEYSMVIDDSSVVELDDIDFKINSWDNKKPNYSCVCYKDGTGFHFVDTVWNKALSDEVTGSTFTKDDKEIVSDGSLRPEWWYVYRIYKQYNKPSVKLKLTLRNNNNIYGLYTCHNMNGKQFIVDNINTDYRYWKSEINLIEKK